MEAFHDIVRLTIIVGRKQRDVISTEISQHGGRLLGISYGQGSVKASYLKDALGLTPEENKVIITCLMAKKKTDEVFEMLNTRFHFNKPNTGIAFTTPVEEVSF